MSIVVNKNTGTAMYTQPQLASTCVNDFNVREEDAQYIVTQPNSDTIAHAFSLLYFTIETHTATPLLSICSDTQLFFGSIRLL